MEHKALSPEEIGSWISWICKSKIIPGPFQIQRIDWLTQQICPRINELIWKITSIFFDSRQILAIRCNQLNEQICASTGNTCWLFNTDFDLPVEGKDHVQQIKSKVNFLNHLQ